VLGAFGELHPEVCRAFEIPERVVAAELAFAPIAAHLPGRVKTQDVPRLPAAYVDLAVVLDEGVEAERTQAVIVAEGAPEVVAVRLFDVYRGEQVPEGKKSLAFALELRGPERTFTDREIAAVRDRITAALERELGGRLRS